MTANVQSVTPDDALVQLKWASQHPIVAKKAHLLLGAPGVGKTSLVEEFAAWRAESAAQALETAGKMAEATAMRAAAADPFSTGILRLLILNTMDPADVGGVRFLDHEKKETITYRPSWMPDEHDDRPITIFVDELTTVDKHLQAPIYSLLQERRVGQFRLHPNTMIIAAGNGPEHGAISYDMSSAVMDRLYVQDINIDAGAWLKWAQRTNVHPAVCAAVKMNPTDLETCEIRVSKNLSVSASPRGWADISDLAYANDKVPLDRAKFQSLVAGRLGTRIAATFFLLYEQRDVLLDLDRMLTVKTLKEVQALLPKEDDKNILGKLHMLCFSMSNLVVAANIDRICDILFAIYNLNIKMATKDIATAGFEMVLEKVLKDKEAMANLFKSKAYGDYEKVRQAQGLSH